jgi:hypothetical protein
VAVDIHRNSTDGIAMIKRISVASARSQDAAPAGDSTDECAESAIAGRARHAVSACRSGGRSWVVAHPGTSLMLALCGGAILGWLMKRR